MIWGAVMPTPAPDTPQPNYAAARWIGCHPSNFAHGRMQYHPIAIVLHIMDGSLDGTGKWFNTPEEERGPDRIASSAHYGIGQGGTVHQYVREEDRAYHAGRVYNPTWPLVSNQNPNFITIGIEHEGYPGDMWSDAMISASVRLQADICRRWHIPADRQHIIGHKEIYAAKSCPGPRCPIDRIVNMVAARVQSLIDEASK